MIQIQTSTTLNQISKYSKI